MSEPTYEQRCRAFVEAMEGNWVVEAFGDYFIAINRPGFSGCRVQLPVQVVLLAESQQRTIAELRARVERLEKQLRDTLEQIGDEEESAALCADIRDALKEQP